MMKDLKNKLIGRKEEQKLLKQALNSKKSEFIAIYGRRRVGKTYLVKNVFEGLNCSFIYVSGMKNGDVKQQTKNVIEGVENGLSLGENVLMAPTSWINAFKLLTTMLERQTSKQKIVLFLDELPWLASRRSNCLQALDYFII